jgi:hypothetical protein
MSTPRVAQARLSRTRSFKLRAITNSYARINMRSLYPHSCGLASSCRGAIVAQARLPRASLPRRGAHVLTKCGFLRAAVEAKTEKWPIRQIRRCVRLRESVHRAAVPIRGAAMTQDVLGAVWFIMLLISIYGMVTGDLCLCRRDD